MDYINCGFHALALRCLEAKIKHVEGNAYAVHVVCLHVFNYWTSCTERDWTWMKPTLGDWLTTGIMKRAKVLSRWLMHPPAAATFHNFLWRIGIDGFISSEPNQEILRFINALLSFEGGYENKTGTFFFLFASQFLSNSSWWLLSHRKSRFCLHYWNIWKEFCFALRTKHICLHKHVILSFVHETWSIINVTKGRASLNASERDENLFSVLKHCCPLLETDKCKIKYLIRWINNDAHHNNSPSRVTQSSTTQTHGELFPRCSWYHEVNWLRYESPREQVNAEMLALHLHHKRN